MISDNLFAPQLPKDCDCCDDGYDCMKTEYQYADVSIPIKISPDIKVGKITSECTGKASICYCENCCENSCEFTVTQKIKIKIPIEYNVNVDHGDSIIKCSCS